GSHAPTRDAHGRDEREAYHAQFAAPDNTCRNMSTAFFISSIVPIEILACVVSGGNARPTRIPCLAHASLNAFESRPIATMMKFVFETPLLYPMLSNARRVNSRASRFSWRSLSMCAVSRRGSIAGPAVHAATVSR